jgi:outer membrane protein assembly factor BamA
LVMLVACCQVMQAAPHSFPHTYPFTIDTVKRTGRIKETILRDTSTQYAWVNRIYILGNKKTRERIIERELTLKPGDSVQLSQLPKILEKDQQRLFNLQLFNSAEVRAFESGPKTIDLLVEVNERWYTFPVPIFQLADRNFNEWWQTYNHDISRVMYGLKLYQYNMRGRNETLTFTAQFGFIQRFELMYRVPYFDRKQKQGLIFQADYIDAKNVAYRTQDHRLVFLETDQVLRNSNGVGVTYTYRNNFYRYHRFGYQFRYTSISDSLNRANPNYLGPDRLNQQFDMLMYQFIADYRDVVAYPLSGYNFLFTLQKYGFAFTEDLEKLDLSFHYAHYLDLKKNFYLSNFTFGYWSNRDDIPYYNYGAMGYNRIFLRGHELNVIEGPTYFLNKTTLKKKIFSQTYSLPGSRFKQFKYMPLAIYLKTYFDFGYVKNYSAYENAFPPQNTILTNNMISGTGIGLDFVALYDSVFRLEYSFNSIGYNGLFIHIKKEF